MCATSSSDADARMTTIISGEPVWALGRMLTV